MMILKTANIKQTIPKVKITDLKSEQDHHDQLPGLFSPGSKKTSVAHAGGNWRGGRCSTFYIIYFGLWFDKLSRTKTWGNGRGSTVRGGRGGRSYRGHFGESLNQGGHLVMMITIIHVYLFMTMMMMMMMTKKTIMRLLR